MRERLLAAGLKMAGETDPDWRKFLYLLDPNGILVEFSYTHRPERFDQSPDEAYRRLFETRPEDSPETARKEA